jgi:16S rRNA (cytosine967-C5)-methyltransferase
MRPGAKVAAAIEIVDVILNRYQPVATALSDWGKANRFAGSGDRNAIGGLVYDTLRRRASAAFIMGNDSPRALVLGTLLRQGTPAHELAALCTGADHAPDPMTDEEGQRVATLSLDGAPPWIVGDYQEWLHPSFERVFGATTAEQGVKLSERAPADLRVNTAKSTREKVLKALASFNPVVSPWSSNGIRIPAALGNARTPNLQAEAAYQAGWFEIQDEGSQIAAALAGPAPRLQILDLCAGGGGKTLAMAPVMQNTGQIYAYDADRNRLKPIFDRIKRAGIRNVQVLRGGDQAALDELGARFDIVFVDAPCTGTGTWRRRPDAKWRLRPDALAERVREQKQVLAEAKKHVKLGGRLIYVTCSLLPEENTDQVAAFITANPEFSVTPFADAWRANLATEPPLSADGRTDSLVLTPRDHGTDGFFIAVLHRAK